MCRVFFCANLGRFAALFPLSSLELAPLFDCWLFCWRFRWEVFLPFSVLRLLKEIIYSLYTSLFKFTALRILKGRTLCCLTDVCFLRGIFIAFGNVIQKRTGFWWSDVHCVCPIWIQTTPSRGKNDSSVCVHCSSAEVSHCAPPYLLAFPDLPWFPSFTNIGYVRDRRIALLNEPSTRCCDISRPGIATSLWGNECSVCETSFRVFAKGVFSSHVLLLNASIPRLLIVLDATVAK